METQQAFNADSSGCVASRGIRETFEICTEENLRPDRDAYFLLNEASSLVHAALGISLMADLDCASDIGDPNDEQTARGALPKAAVSLLRNAEALLCEMEGYLIAVARSSAKETAQ